MRVLIVSDVSGNMHGGVPVETAHLLRGLSARGHELALCGDVLPRGGSEVSRHFPVAVPTNGELPRQLRGAIESFDPEFIHVMAMSSRGLFQIVPEMLGRRWALTCHSVPPYERKLSWLHAHDMAHYAARRLRYLPHTAAWKWLFRHGMIPRVIVHSELMRATVTRYGQAPDATSLIRLGCVMVAQPPDAAPHAPRPRRPRIVTMGGIAHTKGLHDAIVAVAEVRRDFPDLEYQLIGEVRDETYVRFLRRTIERLGLVDCVRITPSLPHDEKEQALRSADLYLQPSHEEGFCLAYIEAAAVVPRLVGADTGAIHMIGSDDPGARTVPIRQPARLASAIRELLATELPTNMMVRRAERLQQRFSWSAYLDEHEALYRAKKS